MNLNLIKSGIQLFAATGAGLIADHALDLLKPNNVKGVKKLAVTVGGVVVSMMVADKVSSYVEETWDNTVEGIQEFVSKETEEDTEAEKA